MDAHKVIKEVFYQFGINDVSEYTNYIYVFVCIMTLLSYILTYKKEPGLINLVRLKRKVKDLESLTSELSIAIEKIEENQEIAEKQNSFRLDMQSAEQKDIRVVVNNLKNSIEQVIQNLYESEIESE